MANRDVWDAVQQTDGTQAQSFEFLLAAFLGGVRKQLVDITDVNPAFTAKTRARNTYAAKGVDAALKYGENLVLSWSHEPVRDGNGLFQAELNQLLQVTRKKGADNLIRLQAYDALGADYAFDGLFSLSVTRNGTGWDDATWFNFTATQYRFNGWITNPVLTGNVPNVTLVSPANAVAGSTFYVQGSGFTGVATGGVKVGTATATNIVVVNDGLISATMPAGTAGATTVTVTSPAGAGNAFPYTRGA